MSEKKNGISLPKTIKYDLKGFRGFNVVDFPLKVEYRKEDGVFVAHYTNEKAGVSLGRKWGKTKEEALCRLNEYIRINQNKLG